MIPLLRQMRAGETQQQPATFDPFSNCRFIRWRIRPRIRENQGGKLALEKLLTPATANFAEWAQRPLDVVILSQQRLSFCVRRGDDPDWAPAPAFVDQQHRAGGLIALDFNARNPISKLARHRLPYARSFDSRLDRRSLAS